MSDTPASPAQAYIVAAHLRDGRPELAALAAALPPEWFADADRQMEAAFLLGMANALTALEAADGPLAPGAGAAGPGPRREP